ncbi:MAG: histidinol-phosphate transaminase [Acidobacteria bacterium]|nr:histidinol-phosphate transaminase [Acidobacteriota bacterium]
MNAALDYERFVPAYIRRFQAYIPSKPDDELRRMYGFDRLYRLNNNENFLGPPPAALRVLRDHQDGRKIAIYPSGDSFYLRQALAERFGKDPDQFLVGNGSCEVIATVIKAFCEAGDNIVTADRTFAVYEWVAEFSGFEARLVPLRDNAFDDEAMLARVDGRTKIIFICNPNNPTGTGWNRDRLARFLDRARHCVVVVDEAYCEFVDDPDFPDGMKLMETYPNLVIFRTFSKMFGLAGLRVGYLAAEPALMSFIRRPYVVYSVNTLAQAAAAEAVRHGEEHVRATRAMVREGKAALLPALERLGLPYVNGEGNFIMVKVPLSDTLFYRRMMPRGFMVRTMTSFRYPGWIRVTVAPAPVMAAFAAALEDASGAGKATCTSFR